MSTELVKTEGKQTLATTLDKMRPYLLAVLPKHLDPDKMLKLALLASQKQPLLKQCSLESVARAVMYVGQLGLEIGRTAHLIPFRGKDGYECQFIPDYTGLIDLAERSGKVAMVDAECAYEDDDFEYARGTESKIHHRPNLKGDRTKDKMVAAYAVATRSNGMRQFVVVSKEEIDATRARSRAANNGPWVSDYPRMAMKTAVKRLAKYLPQSPELAAAIEADNRFESGEVSTVSALLDTEESLAPELTKGADSLKKRLAGQKKPEADADGVVTDDVSQANLALDAEMVEAERAAKRDGG